MASTYNAILDAVLTQVNNLGLALGTYTLPVVKRKLPKVQETIDGALPIITICPADKPELVLQSSFDGLVEVQYMVEIVMIAAGNRDFFTNLDRYLDWRQQIRRLYQQNPSGFGVQGVWDANPNMEWVLNRQLVNSNYDYSGMAIQFSVIESRT